MVESKDIPPGEGPVCDDLAVSCRHGYCWSCWWKCSFRSRLVEQYFLISVLVSIPNA